MYKEVFIKSWKDLKNNPLLFLPDTILFFTNIILALLFLKYSGVLKFVTDPELLAKELTEMMPMVKLFLKQNMLRLIITLTLFALTSFLLGSGLAAMKFGMIKEMLGKKRLTLRKMISHGRFVWQVVSMKMTMFVIGAVTFLLMLGTGIILSIFIDKVIVMMIMGLLFPLFILLLQLSLFFRYPVMFLEGKHPIRSVKESFEYFFKNKKHVFIVWLIVFLISLVMIPISTLFGLGEQKMILLSATVIAGYLLSNIIRIIINLWSDVFKFRNYQT